MRSLKEIREHNQRRDYMMYSKVSFDDVQACWS
jgi:hypothetical protein